MASRRINLEHNNTINYPVDRKSRQVANKEVLVAQLGRTKLRGAEPFNESTANALLEKHLRRRHRAAPAIFLVDRIRFTKKKYHEYLSYREIHNFHRFPNNPDKFMLFVVEEKRGNRSYESFRCENAADVQDIRNMISAAHNDPKRLLQGVGPIRMLSVSSSSSSEYYIENRPASRNSRPRSVQYVINESLPQTEPMCSPRVYYRTNANGPLNSDARNDLHQHPSHRGTQPTDSARLSTATNDVTYLRSDNLNGPQIVEHGPVYMYMSRSRQNRNENSWSPDTSKSKVNLQLSLNQLVQSEVGTATSSDYGCAGNGDMKASTQHFCVDNRETYDTIDKYQKVSPTTCMTDQECQTEFPINTHVALDKKYLPTLNAGTDSYPVTRLGNRLDRGHNIGSETEVSKRSVTTISALAAVAAVAAASYLSRSMHASSIDTSTPPIQWSLSNASKSVYVSSEKTRSEQEKNQQACTQSMIAGKPETNDAILQSSVFPMAAPCSTRTHSEVQRQPSFMNQRVPPIDGLQALENNYRNYSQCVGDGNLKLRILCNAPQTDVDECIPQINGQQSLAYSWHESYLNPPNSPRPSTKSNLLAPPTLSRTDYQPRTRFAQRIEIARQAINDQAVTPVTHHVLWGRRGFSRRSPPPATDSSTDEGHCVEQYMRSNSVVFNAKDEVACNVPQDVKTMSRIVVMEEKCYSEDDNSETDGTRLDRVHSKHPTSAQVSKLAHHKLNHSRSSVMEKESQSDSGASLGSEGAQTQSDEVTPQGMRQPKSVLISGYSKQRKNDKNSG
ncbi:unnamed protein product [Dicrocoelium dendriticum]|nr:unnamed protein product [Dicrocoelium dendriticum]